MKTTYFGLFTAFAFLSACEQPGALVVTKHGPGELRELPFSTGSASSTPLPSPTPLAIPTLGTITEAIEWRTKPPTKGVAPTGNAPDSLHIALTGEEDVPIAVLLTPGALGAYLDAEGDLATSVEVRNVASGTLESFACATGVCTSTFTPLADHAGAASFEFRITAGEQASPIWALATIDLRPIADPPVGNDLAIEGLEGESIDVVLAPGPLSGYTDAESDLATAVSTRNVADGSLGPWTCDAAGACTATFTPVASFSGVAGFEVKVTAGGATATAWSAVRIDFKERARLVISKSGDFGAVDEGAVSNATFVVTNTSAHTTATALVLPVLSSPFSAVSSGCGSSLPPGGSCLVVVAYQPSSFSSQSLTYTVSFDDNGSLAGGASSASETASGHGRAFVTAAYPTNGPHWAQWIARSDSSKNLFSQSDTACDATTATSLASCFHAGEIRAVHVMGRTSCAGLTATDSAGIFDWTCTETIGSVWFHSRLRDGKGLRDLIVDTPALGWRPLTVTLLDGTTTLSTSASAEWWSTAVSAVPSTVNAASPNRVLLARGYPTVHVVAATGPFPPIDVGHDNAAFVTLGSARMEYDGTTDSVCEWPGSPTVAKRCSMRISGRRFVWMEAEIDSFHSATTAVGGVGINASAFVVLRNTRVGRARGDFLATSRDGSGVQTRFLVVEDSIFTNTTNDNGLNLQDISDSRIENVRVASVPTHGILLNNADRLVMRSLTVSRVGSEMISVNNGSDSNVFQEILAVAGQQGVRIYPTSTGNVIHATTVANIGRDGVAGTDFSDNPTQSSAGFDIQGPTNLLANVVSLNTRYFPFMLRSFQSGSGGCASGMNGTGLIIHNAAALGSQKDYVGALTAMRDCSGTNATTSLNSFSGWFLHDKRCVFTYPGSGNSFDDDCSLPGVAAATRRKFAAANEYNDAFVKWVVDASNTTPTTAGAAPHTSTSGLSAFDWRRFENLLRTWLLDTAEVTSTLAAGRCRDTHTCRIVDYSLKRTDTVFLNRADMTYNAGTSSWDGDASSYAVGVLGSWSGASCPSALDGNKALTSGGKTFLVNALEILDDGIGNDDGLCQSDEACAYAPNVGAYQGHGALSLGACVFGTGGAVAGVRMHARSFNGY